MNRSSKEIKRRMRQVSPIVKSAELILEQQRMKLAAVQAELGRAMESLSALQNEYYLWLDKVNLLRSSPDRSMLFELEAGLDAVKNRCFEAFKQVHALRAREKQQKDAVESARRDFSAKDRMLEKFAEDHRKQSDLEQSKAVDEIVSLRHARRET